MGTAGKSRKTRGLHTASPVCCWASFFEGTFFVPAPLEAVRDVVTVELDARVELRVARGAAEASGTGSSDVRLR